MAEEQPYYGDGSDKGIFASSIHSKIMTIWKDKLGYDIYIPEFSDAVVNYDIDDNREIERKLLSLSNMILDAVLLMIECSDVSGYDKEMLIGCIGVASGDMLTSHAYAYNNENENELENGEVSILPFLHMSLYSIVKSAGCEYYPSLHDIPKNTHGMGNDGMLRMIKTFKSSISDSGHYN
jgi:hypothetical protein